MLGNPKLKYIENTYKSFGNNGNCYDNSINSPDCAGDFSQELREHLYNMSDHLPIVMDLETDKEIVLDNPDFAIISAILLENTMASSELNIRLASSVSESVSFEIYNTLGQKLLEFTSENTGHISIDISQFANGIYYLKTSIPGFKTLKFLKTP